jgi:hypothetical protein
MPAVGKRSMWEGPMSRNAFLVGSILVALIASPAVAVNIPTENYAIK